MKRSSPPRMAAHTDDQQYIAWRVIDAYLRENLRDLLSRGRAAAPPPAVLQTWPEAAPELWWRITHLPTAELWLPLARSDYMQPLRATGDAWVSIRAGQARHEHGLDAWFGHLAAGLDAQTCALHRAYLEEAACAAEHRALAREAARTQAPRLAMALEHADWAERALRCDQLASYRDHPFYPTARAKAGFSAADLAAYAPEFGPEFELNWLALPRAAVTLTSPQPAWWPTMETLGLDPALAVSHVPWPMHPLTFAGLDDAVLPADAQRAPRRHLRVRPTLSVRTVAILERPDAHLKLPLAMCTLGARNLRLIKPSTLYDGHWFERVLTALARTDPGLAGHYLHVDESHGGHLGEDVRQLAYLLRQYPDVSAATLVPVAGLCSAMPDGRPLAEHLANHDWQGDLLAWWRDYAQLMCTVHLRLWLLHGIALEANQQNSVLIYQAGQPTRLLMKDNDAARLWQPRLRESLPALADFGALRDPRIAVDGDAALAQMFCTIILQLDLLAVLEGVAEYRPALRQPMYAALREIISGTLTALAAEGIDTTPAQQLLAMPRLPVKYLLTAGSLFGKQATGAADINKFYGDSAPNFMTHAEYNERPAES